MRIFELTSPLNDPLSEVYPSNQKDNIYFGRFQGRRSRGTTLKFPQMRNFDLSLPYAHENRRVSVYGRSELAHSVPPQHSYGVKSIR